VMTREICEKMFRIPFPSRGPQKEKWHVLQYFLISYLVDIVN
jgi:hypothetical protein